MLEQCGWVVQFFSSMNIAASVGVTVREFPLKSGFADYLLYISGRVIGVIDAKPEGRTVRGVKVQSAKYLKGLPPGLPRWNADGDPLSFTYESTGTVTQLTNSLDPAPRSREVFSFHHPEELARLAGPSPQLGSALRAMPPLATSALCPKQVTAIQNLEKSLRTVIAEPLNAFVEIAANVGESRRHMKSRARTTAGQTGISGLDIQQMPIPLPPLAEQSAIVSELDRRLCVADAAEQKVEHALQRAARLRKSILKRAFEGRLVPRDPTNEPAATLLRRQCAGQRPSRGYRNQRHPAPRGGWGLGHRRGEAQEPRSCITPNRPLLGLTPPLMVVFKPLTTIAQPSMASIERSTKRVAPPTTTAAVSTDRVARSTTTVCLSTIAAARSTTFVARSTRGVYRLTGTVDWSKAVGEPPTGHGHSPG